MKIEFLHVYNINKKNGFQAPTEQQILAMPQALLVETCQRWICISAAGPIDNSYLANQAVTALHGEEAYHFLLEVACGLRSSLLGEPDIFGQFKAVWKKQQHNPEKTSLNSVINNLFQDTKEVRSLYLEGLGGSSYASATRKLLKKYESGSVLVLGAGNLAQTVVPMLPAQEVFVWNRTEANTDLLADQVLKKHNCKITKVKDQELAARLAETLHVVVCIPQHESDATWFSHWQKNINNHDHRSVIHLGVHCDGPVAWDQSSHYHCLDDVYQIEKKQVDYREKKIKQAKRACSHRSMLRSLDGSARTAHGWEYLALFT